MKIEVGSDEEKQTFLVHPAILTARSPFFKAALDGNCKEAEENIVRLPKDSPEVFGVYMHHVYTGTLAVRTRHFLAGSPSESECILLAKTYVLSEKLQDVEAKNNALRALMKGMRPIWWAHHRPLANDTTVQTTTSIIYDGTPQGSPARKLLVDFFTYNAGSDDLQFNGSATHWRNEFIADLAVSLLAIGEFPNGDDPTSLDDTSEYMEPEPKTT